MKSKRLFCDKAAAEAYIPEFETKCYDKNHFEHAAKGTVRISVVEYEIEGEG